MSSSWSHPCLPKVMASELFAPTAQGAVIQGASRGFGCLPQHDIFVLSRDSGRGCMAQCLAVFSCMGYCSKPCKSFVDGPRVVAVPRTAKRCHTSLRNACPVHCCQSFPHPISIQHTHTLTLSSPFAFSTHTHTHLAPTPLAFSTHTPPATIPTGPQSHHTPLLRLAGCMPLTPWLARLSDIQLEPGWPDCQIGS